MAQAIAILKLLISLGPEIIKFVQRLEELFPDGGIGEQKLEILRAYLQSIWDGLGTIIPAFEDVWPKIQAAVAVLVALFNKLGIFKK